jgi:hypothetical protein
VLVTDPESLWDTSTTWIEPDTSVNYSFTNTITELPELFLIAETPVIELPMWVGDDIVLGRAVPGGSVQVHDEATDELIGSGTVGSDGRFSISLNSPLNFGMRVYPVVNGVEGIAVEAMTNNLYLPGVQR